MNDQQFFEIPNDAEHYHQCVYYKIGTHNLLYAWLCGQWVRKSYDPKMTFDILSSPVSGPRGKGYRPISDKAADYLRKQEKLEFSKKHSSAEIAENILAKVEAKS
jgi:hypothetical protein